MTAENSSLQTYQQKRKTSEALNQSVQTTLEMLRPYIAVALSESRTAHNEQSIRITKNTANLRPIQIKVESCGIYWWKFGTNQKKAITKLPVTEKGVEARTEQVINAIKEDIKHLFLKTYEWEALHTVELAMKFRDASMISLHRIEKRQKNRVQRSLSPSIDNKTQNVLELLRNDVKWAIADSRHSESEKTIKLIYERNQNCCQIKSESSNLWAPTGTKKKEATTFLEIGSKNVQIESEQVISLIAEDVRQLFVNVYDINSLGNVELIFKIGGDMVDVQRTEYRCKKATVWIDKNIRKT